MNPSDQLAFEIGRSILDLHIARQTIVSQEQRIAELQAQLAEHNGTEPRVTGGPPTTYEEITTNG